MSSTDSLAGRPPSGEARRRVVVTGFGLVTPLATGVEATWRAAVAGQSGIGPLTRIDTSGLTSRIAGEVRDFRPTDFVEHRDLARMDDFILFAVAAARQAFTDAALTVDPLRASRYGTIVGVGFGGVSTLEQMHRIFMAHGLARVSPFAIPRTVSNLAPAHITIQLGLRGVSFALTTACASGAHAIGEAARMIRCGAQDVVLAGGCEAPLSEIGIAGFCAMRALSQRNDEPARASRPFDRDRDGFVMAEGAGMLVLEDLEHARRRGARVRSELVGYGATSDGYHVAAPLPDGSGAAACMTAALEDAGIPPDAVDYINAHGSSTTANDRSETLAIKRALGTHAHHVAVSSTKSMTGHMLGAAGAVEAALTALAIEKGAIPPTINYDAPDPDCDLDYVPNRARSVPLHTALSNSFGFGGANACLAFRRWEPERDANRRSS